MIYIGPPMNTHPFKWVPGKMYKIEIPNGKLLWESNLRFSKLSLYVIDDTGDRIAVNKMHLDQNFRLLSEIRNDKIDTIFTKSESVNILNK